MYLRLSRLLPLIAAFSFLAIFPVMAEEPPVDASPIARPGQSRIYTPPLESESKEESAQQELRLSNAPVELTAPEPAMLSLSYDENSTELDAAEQAKLQSFADGFKSGAKRIELRSFAGPKAGTSSPARRLALKRALMVRTFLLSQGVAADRLIVRALGGTRDTGPNERIDILNSKG